MPDVCACRCAGVVACVCVRAHTVSLSLCARVCLYLLCSCVSSCSLIARFLLSPRSLSLVCYFPLAFCLTPSTPPSAIPLFVLFLALARMLLLSPLLFSPSTPILSPSLAHSLSLSHFDCLVCILSLACSPPLSLFRVHHAHQLLVDMT